MTSAQDVAFEISNRLGRIFLRGPDGRRPAYGRWTGLVAFLMQESGYRCPIATGRAFGKSERPAANGGAGAGTVKASRRE